MATSQPATVATTVATITASSDAGQRAVHTGREGHDGNDDGHQNERGDRQGTECISDRLARDDRGVVAVGFGDPEGGGHLLQEDDHRDAEGESLDDGPRYVGEYPTEPEQAGRDDEDSGEHPDDDHGVGPVAGNERDEHDGHRSRRARHLQVGTTEDAGDEPGDDRGREPGRGAEPGGDPERQRQRQRDDADREPSDDVGAPRPRESRIVAAARQHR